MRGCWSDGGFGTDSDVCLQQPENDFAKAKLEMVQTIIKDLEGLVSRV
ncbi:hypothetical protein [Clostridium vincentii]|nr:hypothetical protein [Clostridium vincentii]